MITFTLSVRRAALALVAAASMAACTVKEPPVQLEARLYPAGSEIKDRITLARNIVRELNIDGLEIEHVRVAIDRKTNQYFFRLVGEDPLRPELLKQVSAGLGALNQTTVWKGKLLVDPDPHFDTFLKTTAREFPFSASWGTATVEMGEMLTPEQRLRASIRAQNAHIPKPPDEDPEPETVITCFLSFAPDPPLPILNGKFKDIVKVNLDIPDSIRDPLGMTSGEFSIPHRVEFDQDELASLHSPLVRNGKIWFRFGQIRDYGPAPQGHIGASPNESMCRHELSRGAMRVSRTLERMENLPDLKGFGPARILSLPPR